MLRCRAGVRRDLFTRLQQLATGRDAVVASFIQAMHTYQLILKELAQSLQIDAPMKDIEKELIQAAQRHEQSQNTLYIVIDDVHLLENHRLAEFND